MRFSCTGEWLSVVRLSPCLNHVDSILIIKSPILVSCNFWRKVISSVVHVTAMLSAQSPATWSHFITKQAPQSAGFIGRSSPYERKIGRPPPCSHHLGHPKHFWKEVGTLVVPLAISLLLAIQVQAIQGRKETRSLNQGDSCLSKKICVYLLYVQRSHVKPIKGSPPLVSWEIEFDEWNFFSIHCCDSYVPPGRRRVRSPRVRSPKLLGCEALVILLLLFSIPSPK